MNTSLNLFVYVLIIGVLFGLVYYNHVRKMKVEEVRDFYNQPVNIDDYFYHADMLSMDSKRRKMWIHVPSERNSRFWLDMGSRSSTNINLPYMSICVKSIIDWCAQSYDIIIFDDSNIPDILESNDVDLGKISGPLLTKYREMCLLKILYKYGGVLVPPTMFLRTNLADIDKTNDDNIWYVTDNVNTQHVSMSTRMPSVLLSGSNRNNAQLKAYISFLDETLVSDFDEDSIHFQKNYLRENNVQVIDGSVIGTKDAYGNNITIDHLMSTKPIQFASNNIGLYIPSDELLRRRQYQWFNRLSIEQVLQANTNISYYMIRDAE